LNAHGFYCRTLVDVEFDGSIRVRRYLCRLCKRTVSLLPEFALPYQRFSISVISLFLVARLLESRSLREAARAACQPSMPYQRGQFWIRRWQKQAVALCAALASAMKAIPMTTSTTEPMSSPRATRFRNAWKDMTAAWAKLDHAVNAIRLRFADGSRAASSKKMPSVT
jgi:Domain of unknown function (DUF6431)